VIEGTRSPVLLTRSDRPYEAARAATERDHSTGDLEETA
jgi:hypothetical protein